LRQAQEFKIRDYQIERYQPAQRAQVVDIIGHLLGSDRAANERYFAWKYEQNPHADGVMGIVATCRGKVVGFRGYGSSLWQWGAGRTLRVLMPGDTCVDPAHRRKGLSVAMGQLAMTGFSPAYPLFLNLSCTRSSLPGYLRLGFAPLAEKVYLSRYGRPGLAAYLLSSKQRLPLAAAKIRSGQFGSVQVSAVPMPEQMASVVERQEPAAQRFQLCQDESYFRWRFSGPKDKYVFYCLSAGSDPVAYLVLGVTPANRRGYMMDCADTDGESGARLLDFVIQRRDFSVLSVYSHSVGASLEPALRRAGFHVGGILGALERKVRGNMPLLVRPVPPDPKRRTGSSREWTFVTRTTGSSREFARTALVASRRVTAGSGATRIEAS
jgi:GNAT superfamily N-acetyltransferase